MNRSRVLIAAGVILFLIFMNSCEKVVFEPIEIELPDTISYSVEIQPIFDENCISCHGGTVNPDLRADVSYSNLLEGGYIDTVNAEGSALIEKLHEGVHDSRATLTEKQLILEWIKNGAPDN
jgi:hypothetical protein